MNRMVDNMIKGKKSGKSLDEIGERWYSFSLKSEKLSIATCAVIVIA